MPFELTIVTPQGQAYQGPVDRVVLPGSEGDFGVLPAHERFLAPLRIGAVEIRAGSETLWAAIADGFAEVTPSRCTVLAEEAMPVGDIDRAEVEHQLKNLQDDLLDTKTDEDKAAIQRKIATAAAKLQVSS